MGIFFYVQTPFILACAFLSRSLCHTSASCIVAFAAVIRVVTQRYEALRDDSKNGCGGGDYIMYSAKQKLMSHAIL